jgi:outer membrane protein assembly factor BamD (BamD/ComL family)
MVEYEEPSAPQGLNIGRLAAAAMAVGGALLAVVATVWALVRFWEVSQTKQPAAGEVVQTAVLLLAGWAFALLLWGAAEILRRLDEVLEALRAGTTSSAGAPALPGARPTDLRPDQQAHMLEELVHLTREVRDIGLLNESERSARLQHESGELVKQLEAEVPSLLREHKLQEASDLVQRARRRFPAMSNWDALAQQVEQARAKFEAHDLALATREVDDLAALGAWDRVTEVVRRLRRRHPASEQVAELERRVAVARERATAEERARLMSQAQDATSRHDWPRALELVEMLLARFPGSPEAQELRQQAPTLKANVEIHARQMMDADIRNLVKQQRFADALRIANELIDRYPDSPQATALRDQLPRLQQKAAEVA